MDRDTFNRGIAIILVTYVIRSDFSSVCVLADDSCTNYTNLTDTTRTIHHLLGPHDKNGNDIRLKPGWYRFISPSDAWLTMTCPKDKECGTNKPVWMNGSLPLASDKEVSRSICMKRGSDCCGQASTIAVRNCTEFFVYQLHPSSGTYCFDGTPATTPTVSEASQGTNSAEGKGEKNKASRTSYTWLQILFYICNIILLDIQHDR